MKHDSQKGETK